MGSTSIRARRTARRNTGDNATEATRVSPTDQTASAQRVVNAMRAMPATSARVESGHATGSRQAAWDRCTQCMDGTPHAACEDESCQLYPHRYVSRAARQSEGARLKAIRAYCLWCGGTWLEVKECPSTPCALWPFRFGVRPQTAAKRGERTELPLGARGKDEWTRVAPVAASR